MKKSITRLLAIVIFAVVSGVFVFWQFSMGYLIWMASDFAWVALALFLFKADRPSGHDKGDRGHPEKPDQGPSLKPDQNRELVGVR
jgi:hypothetical protein